MRPAAIRLVTHARAYVAAHKPTSELTHALADAVARELAKDLGGTVTITLPGAHPIVITRTPEGSI